MEEEELEEPDLDSQYFEDEYELLGIKNDELELKSQQLEEKYEVLEAKYRKLEVALEAI